MAFITMCFWFTKRGTLIYRDPAIVRNYVLEYNKFLLEAKSKPRTLYMYLYLTYLLKVQSCKLKKH